ncbi:Haloacid dehalogenase domain protein hydrolase [Denitrovibrio acetiphilus DSM 12809]|uniref:Haloacid dehalogenase domain protein hydrolase n=2 Tax=Denitrovibrio TaxID=117999 RepID=D4H641_DENA2|nr:Haloacid dehalogenase domain protein hydrolase [Denitrovibrio acetiphilus DSM 12809]
MKILHNTVFKSDFVLYNFIMKNILFDLDGTLTDPHEGIIKSIKYALDKLNAPIPSHNKLKKYIGPPLWESFKEMLNTDSDAEANKGVMLYRERFSTKGLFENQPYDGIDTALSYLNNKGYALYICTSKPQVFAKQIAEYFGFDHYFKGIYGSNLDGSLVDKSHLISHILQKENLLSVNSSMIGDRRYDIQGACNNKVTPYGVSYGFGSPDELKDAVRIFNTPVEITEHF